MMAADVVAIGVYAEELAPYVSPQLQPKVGDELALLLFVEWGLGGSSASRALARVLGVEPWDFNTHCFVADGVDLEELSELVGVIEARQFEVLRRCEFEFFFRPNG